MMSGPWTGPAQLTGNPLDSTLSDYLAFGPLDRFDPMRLGLDITPKATSILSDTTFDWSCAINPNLYVLPNPDYFAFETSLGNDSISGQSTPNQQDLGEAILRLDHRMDALERGIEARLVQIKDNVEAIGQRLTKAEEVKQTQDTEYGLPLAEFVKVSLTI